MPFVPAETPELDRQAPRGPTASTDVAAVSDRLTPFRTAAEYLQAGIRRWRDPSDLALDDARAGAQFHLRRQFRQDYGYVLASAELMAVLADLLKPLSPVLDAGCGSGYLSQELTRLGVSTFAVDCRDYQVAGAARAGYPIKSVVQLDALGDAPSFVTDKFGAVLLAWCYDPR